jgi:hypothetical protein
MTTYATTTRIKQTDDATFREWVQEFHDALTAIGLTQTADTGQIDPVTVNRPGTTNTIAGYSMWRFNDTLQATVPIFLKFGFGTYSALERPKIDLLVGEGSDGANNLTGVQWITTTMANNTGASADTAYPSYWCYNTATGSLGIGWKSTSGQAIAFSLHRTCDNTGAPSGVGIGAYNSAASAVWHRDPVDDVTFTNTNAVAVTCAPYGHIGNITDDNGDVPVHLCFVAVPRPAPTVGACGIASGAVAVGSTFQTTLIGATQRTYINIGGNICCVGGYNTCVIWE